MFGLRGTRLKGERTVASYKIARGSRVQLLVVVSKAAKAKRESRLNEAIQEGQMASFRKGWAVTLARGPGPFLLGWCQARWSCCLGSG